MNEPIKFKRLQEIASELSGKLEQLQVGKLSKAELEHLTEAGRELYERLVVLRFKAYQEEVAPPVVVEPAAVELVPEPVREEAPAMPQINFKIEESKPETPIQVSLIDAIEEVSKTLEVQHEVLPKEGHPAELASPVAEQKQVFAPRESIHERLTKSMGFTETLAQKLEHHPIPDLKRAISLNQRFQFSRELFKGNNQDYEVAIDRLNTASRDEAMKHLDSLRNKYAWSPESSVVNDFADLVERRHQ